MVILRVKRGEELIFGYQTTVNTAMSEVVKDIVNIYNGILKIKRLISEVEELITHGVSLPPEMVGLTDEQITELKLVDEWTPKCEPHEGYVFNADPMSRRNGHSPIEQQKAVFTKVMEKAKESISKNLIKQGIFLTTKNISNVLDEFRGAVMIVYPGGIPPYDPIYMELHNIEDLSGTQASMEVIVPAEAVLWFANKQLDMELLVRDALGKHDQSNYTVKLARRSESQPARTPAISEETRRALMSQAFKRQQELEKLAKDDDDHYLNAEWADNQHFKRTMHGLNDIKFRP